GDEVGFTIHLDQHTDPPVAVDVRLHEPLGGDPPRFLGGGREPLLSQVIDGLLHISTRLLKGALAVHHARLGALAQLLHHLARNHPSSSLWHGGHTARPNPNVYSASAAAKLSTSVSPAGLSCSPASSAAASASALSYPSRPSITASASFPVSKRIARMASSFPGIMMSTSSGSQLVSTIAMIGMPSLRASDTAMRSVP